MKWFLFFWGLSALVLAQNPVTGNATITLVDGGTECEGSQRRVEVHVDITGLTGQGGDAGLNAYGISLLLDDMTFFKRAESGVDPIPFSLEATNQLVAQQINELRLVGYKADTQAPNQSYHVATVILGNQTGTVTLDLNASATSLGSRRVGNAGPGPINFVFNGPLATSISGSYPLTLIEALSSWRFDHPTYNVNPVTPQVDILDLISIASCSQL